MAHYSYKVRDKEGRVFEGVMAAERKEEVFSRLSSEGYLITSVRTETRARGRGQLEVFSSRIKARDVNYFIKGLGNLLESGLTLRSALKILAEEGRTRAVKNITIEVERRIEGGTSLSGALTQYPDAFNEMTIAMIRVGEEAGNLVGVLKHLGEYLERSEKVKSSLKSTMTYPLTVLCLAIAASIFLVIFTVPKFMELYDVVGSELPLPTRMLSGFVDWLGNGWKYIVVAAATLFIGLKLALRTKKGRISWDHLKVRIPIIGGLTKKIIISRFARIMATLLESGVLMVPALEIVAQSVGNFFYSQAVTVIKGEVERGENLSDALRKQKSFPGIVHQMAKVGEEGGSLPNLLNKLADSYDEMIADALKATSSLAEPIILSVVGVIIGFIALALYLPVFKSVGALQKGF